jgi:hypothetical protein
MSAARIAVAPISMIIHCPTCRTRHVDEGEFATRPHHTHSCQSCGLTWRPAKVCTIGVRFLPGFKNEAAASPEFNDWVQDWLALPADERGMAIDSLQGTDDDLMPDRVFVVLDGMLRALEKAQ